MSAGFYKRRRGLVEHIENGTIDLLEDGIHDYLSLKANLVIAGPCSIPVGVCFTSAPALHVHCPRVSERTIQRILEHLESIGWIKTFKIPGRRGNYPTLLCRASVHDLSGNEYRINGTKTIDWRQPVYEPVGEVSGSCPETGGNLSGYREEREERREKKQARRPKAAPADSRFQPFFEFALRSFTAKHGRKPLWQGKDWNSLKNLLKNHSAESLPLERLKTNWRNFLESTEAFTIKQGDSLAYFCLSIDKFSDGPILATPQKGRSNGKPSVSENIRATLEAFRATEPKLPA
jgi:hypothetical protein